MKFAVLLLSALVASTRAILITSPPPPATVDVSEDWEVTWTHVSCVEIISDLIPRYNF